MNNTKLIQTSKEVNFEEFNKTICHDEHFILSQRNLIMMYSYLYKYIQENSTNNFDTFLNKTSYFNKIIFLKYLDFFRKFNELRKKMLNDLNTKILDLNNNINKLDTKLNSLQEQIRELQEDIDELQEDIDKLAQEEDTEKYENNMTIIEENEIIIRENQANIDKIIENMNTIEIRKKKIEASLLQVTTRLSMFEVIKDDFSLNTIDMLEENLNAEDSKKTLLSLFNDNIIDTIYDAVITNITNDEDIENSREEYRTLFHLNPINNNSVSSEKAIFYIGVHGTLCIVVPNNQYLTIKTPIDTTINRWGRRGEPLQYFNTMDYTFKQCLLTYGENLDIDTANECFDLLGESKKAYNIDTMQTTPAYNLDNMSDIDIHDFNKISIEPSKKKVKLQTDNCEIEPDKSFAKLTVFNQNTKMRIKHYIVDSFDFMLFYSDYTIPESVFINLSSKITIPSRIQFEKNTHYNTAENIIDLNFLLFTNNINFTIFNMLNIEDDTGISKFGLYPDIGLYPRYYLTEDNRFLQTDLHNFSFPLDIFSFKPRLFTEDFTLDREIYALNDITIHLTYQNIDRSFMLFKGDSFSSNPYIIEYFIKTFNSKITIRPGPILGNKEDPRFEENRNEGTTREKGSTITCLTKGLSCYKVTLAVLTNYEILKFCKDANISTCDLYDTSCQSFQYLNTDGEMIDDEHIPTKEQTLTLKRMNTINDSTMLSEYDNLSDIFLTDFIDKDNFLVVGNNSPVKMNNQEVVGQKRKNETGTIDGGRTKKRINRKKNTHKETKKIRKQNKGKTKKSKTKKSKTKKSKTKRYTNRI
jgi:hypothetical protein